MKSLFVFLVFAAMTSAVYAEKVKFTGLVGSFKSDIITSTQVHSYDCDSQESCEESVRYECNVIKDGFEVFVNEVIRNHPDVPTVKLVVGISAVELIPVCNTTDGEKAVPRAQAICIIKSSTVQD